MIRYLRKFIGATPEEPKALLMDPKFLSLYQALFIGFQYQCFNCIAVCPIGRENRGGSKRKGEKKA